MVKYSLWMEPARHRKRAAAPAKQKLALAA